MRHFIADTRLALRRLSRSPLFTLVAVITVALGIGASTTAFNVVRAVLLRPLPFKEPSRLVVLYERNQQNDNPRNVVSPANFLDWRAQNTVFSEMAAYVSWRAALTGEGEPEEVPLEYTTASFFSLLGVPPQLGRWMKEADDVRGAQPTAVLSHELWRRKFSADPSIVGKSITLGGRTVEVIGVMPEGFGIPASRAQLWVPLGLDPANDYRKTSGRYMSTIARLKDGVSLERAQSELKTIGARLVIDHPQFNSGWGVSVFGMAEEVSGSVRKPLLVLSGAVALVLLIACANLANLLVVRATTRHRELAVRSALGAGRSQIMSLLLIESAVLNLAGGAGGLLLAMWATRLLSTSAAAVLPRSGEIQLDLVGVAFTAVIALATGLLFGAFPAWRGARLATPAEVHLGARTVGTARRTRYALVGTQVALSLVLLTGAGLLGRSFMRLASIDPGFDPEGVLTFRLDLPRQRYGEESAQTAFFDRLLATVRTTPGVESVGAINWLPFGGGGSNTSYFVDGRPIPPPERELGADVRGVDPGYFRALRIPLLKGSLMPANLGATAPKQVVINETLARTVFPDANPLGQRISMPWGDTLHAEIVGVVKDTRSQGLDTPVRPMIYWAMPQFPTNFMTLVVRTAGDPLRLTRAMREAVRQLDSNLPLAELRPLEGFIGDSVARRRVLLSVLGAFAGAALILAMVGLYGSLAYTVSQRSREIGVRMALGARRGTVIQMVLQEGMTVVALGAAAGLLISLAATSALRSLLFDVGPRDPLTFLFVVAALVVAALAASIIPAQRAVRVNPVDALRAD